jgi:hypothetical protein
MGLLDDAIREHLELKRLRGADPGEVAREERETLAETRSDLGTLDESVGSEAVARNEPPQELPAEPAKATAGPAMSGDDASQATAELDMQAVLEEDAAGSPEGGPVNRPITGRHGAYEDEDMETSSLEWEVPGEEAGGRELDETHSGRRGADRDA